MADSPIAYRVEVVDTWGRRVAVHDEVPLLEAVRTAPDEADLVHGILPGHVEDLGHGYRVRVFVEDVLFCDAGVTRVEAQWSDSKKLILGRYVSFHEVVEFEAEVEACAGNTMVARGFTNRAIGTIVKGAINHALGPIHYWVDHAAYPDGAVREYGKFAGRKMAENELEVGGISTGQWVGADRIDATGAYAKDGDTIAGLVVDSVAWPDLRMMLIDTQEMSLNSHTSKLHPEVTDWTAEQYAASGYKARADAATTALAALMSGKGLDYIELNPHRDSDGAFDDRVDGYGRYVGLVYGGGECFNAAMVELGHADVYLWQDGAFLEPALELKDFFSYVGAQGDSVAAATETLAQLDVRGGVLEVLTALAYAAGGYVWSVDVDLGVSFAPAERPDCVAFYDPNRLWVSLGSRKLELGNVVYFTGNPLVSTLSKRYERWASVDEYDWEGTSLDYFSLSQEEDADKLAEGLLDDIAYPETQGFLEFYEGTASIGVGDIVEVRDGPVRRLERVVDGEWGNRFEGMHVGRVRRVVHRFSGRHVSTRAWLTSPLRSVSDPVSFMVRQQEAAETLYQFRLDDDTVGLDMGYHLD